MCPMISSAGCRTGACHHGLMASGRSPVGQVTRGTTGTNRLRRVDRWIARHPALRRAADPLVVDLGYGASGVTALELHARLARARPDVEVLGLEIDPARVARARAQLDGGARRPHLVRARCARVVRARRLRGADPDGRRPAVIRAMNVLRQYDESEVRDAWQRMSARLAPDGLLVEGTCDELGRIVTWVAIGPDAAPRTLSISLRLAGLQHPSIAAERLPKALIHRNVPGERVHALPPGARRGVGARGGHVAVRAGAALGDGARRPCGTPAGRCRRACRWRLGEVTVPWDAVAPAA